MGEGGSRSTRHLDSGPVARYGAGLGGGTKSALNPYAVPRLATCFRLVGKTCLGISLS